MKKLFDINYAKSYFNALSVKTENFYKGIGRTDIELTFGNYHIIFECKVRNGYIGKEQVKKYVKCFDKKSKNFLCFLTENIPPTTLLKGIKSKNIKVCYFNWNDIVATLDKSEGQSPKDFINYYERTYKMNNIKEIAVRDLQKGWTTDLFNKNYIYHTTPVSGKPLYFAPYFSKGSSEVGFNYISKVLGVATGKVSDISKDLLQTFANQNTVLIDKWLKGLARLKKEAYSKDDLTIYFLDTPIKFPKPLLKDGGIKKGRGVGWVAGAIPANRTIDFQEFIKRLS